MKTKKSVDFAVPKPHSLLRSHRLRLSPSRKNFVAAKQKWCCNICKELLPYRFQIDHITPISLNGSSCLQNLQAVCGTCHDKKSFHDNDTFWDKKREVDTGISKYFNPKCFAYLAIQV